MLSAPHILETALLILMAFLAGCVAGYVARRLATPRRKPDEAVTAVAPVPEPTPQLVVAPTIAPLPTTRPRRSAAGRLAAAAGREPLDPIRMPGATTTTPARAPVAVTEPAAPPAPPASESPAAAALQPARTAGAATSVIVLPAPTDAPAAPAPATAVPPAPPVEPEPPPEPVRAADVPPIDEAAHVTDTSIAGSPSPELFAGMVGHEPEPTPHTESAPELAPTPVPVAPPEPAPAPEPATTAEPEPAAAAAGTPEPVEQPSAPDLAPAPPERIQLGEDAEAAAMRAVEGGWTPRRPPAAVPQRPTPHPEQTAAEVEAAMATARTAVAAATAAANAAIAENGEANLDFEVGPAAVPQSFLAGEPAPEPESATASGLDFEPQRPRVGYGRPEGLPEPRGGTKDNLKQIKGVTPALESSLNALGIFHFDQVAAWDQKAIVWLDHHLTLKGRIGREKWLDQARELARGRGHPARPVKR